MDVNEDNTLHKFRKTYNDFAAFANVYECINLIKISSYNTLWSNAIRQNLIGGHSKVNFNI